VNKDKRVSVKTLADIVGAYRTARTVPSKVIIVLHNAVEALADSEERSLKKMEPYKDNDGTAANYRAGQAALEDLRGAQEALSEDELDEAYAFLSRVAGVEEPAAPKRRKKVSK
jgi:hypothetical protein